MRKAKRRKDFGSRNFQLKIFRERIFQAPDKCARADVWQKESQIFHNQQAKQFYHISHLRLSGARLWAQQGRGYGDDKKKEDFNCEHNGAINIKCVRNGTEVLP